MVRLDREAHLAQRGIALLIVTAHVIVIVPACVRWFYMSIVEQIGMIGAQGSQGPQGSPNTGAQGSQGPQGSPNTGAQGSQGPQGSPNTGAQGPQGPQGYTGNPGANNH